MMNDLVQGLPKLFRHIAWSVWRHRLPVYDRSPTPTGATASWHLGSSQRPRPSVLLLTKDLSMDLPHRHRKKDLEVNDHVFPFHVRLSQGDRHDPKDYQRRHKRRFPHRQLRAANRPLSREGCWRFNLSCKCYGMMYRTFSRPHTWPVRTLRR